LLFLTSGFLAPTVREMHPMTCCLCLPFNQSIINMTISIEGPLGTKDVFGCPDIGYLHPLMRIISNRRPFGSPHLLA
jgi:hypothetical protein